MCLFVVLNLWCVDDRCRHQENERSLKSNLSLCNETLHMVTYLTSDPDIQKPFLREELMLRLAEMLLCVLKQLVSFLISRCKTLWFLRWSIIACAIGWDGAGRPPCVCYGAGF